MVTDGQNANQTTFNNAFMSRTANDSTIGKKDLQNADAASGANVTNVQREINSLNAFSGRAAGTAHDATPTWTNNDVGNSLDDLKDRAEALTQAFDNAVGHNHDGTAGSGGTLVTASVSNNGVVSTGIQTFGGQKTFNDPLISASTATFNGIVNIQNGLTYSSSTDSSSTGANANIGPFVSVIVIVSNGSLTSIQNIDPATTNVLVLRNDTGGVLEIINNSGGTAANRIITGTGSNLSVANDAQIFIVYDITNLRWIVVGGSGTGGSSGWTTYSNENIAGSGSITSSTSVTNQYRKITGSGGPITASTTPFGNSGGWADGITIRLIGQSLSDTVTLVHNDNAKGAILNGDCELARYDSIELQYDSGADRWIEISRSIK